MSKVIGTIRYEREMQDMQFIGPIAMTVCQQDKMTFVNVHVDSMVKAVNRGYGGCQYMVCGNQTEWVKVFYNSDRTDGYYICVTGNSNLSIAQEVLNSLD